ncbi:GNAT family N-acetyltransferase [Nonomuraea sp. NPDC050328]|uniref:GNAT family N-acetyltransferase n=1 Tax=Nonomuraea sp. NPDC050328 TaxID=3364361 RepID=UPI0037A60E37
MVTAHEQIVGFLREFARRRAPEARPVPGGFAVLDDGYPGSYDDNKLVVWAGDDPRAVLAAAEQALGGRGHRYVSVLDDAVGEAFRPAFEAAGYEHGVDLLMCHRGPVPDAPDAEAVEVDALAEMTWRGWRESLPDAPDEVVDGLVARVERRVRGADRVGFRAVRDGSGEIAARADLYVQDGVAEIADVVTEPRFRKKGHARALVTALLAEAGRAGAGLVFLVADDADWPKEFYGRLGFEPVGRTHGFIRS